MQKKKKCLSKRNGLFTHSLPTTFFCWKECTMKERDEENKKERKYVEHKNKNKIEQ